MDTDGNLRHALQLNHRLMTSYRQFHIRMLIPVCHMEEVEKCRQSVVSLLIGDDGLQLHCGPG